ncbi:ABC transporter permease [Longispora albida]|uniref:ABC transporter permease n=1 Tax=Longispora albida TaxID=203523 RepID=UPI00037C6E60|nr:ABC transporter permease [Longispora albida]
MRAWACYHYELIGYRRTWKGSVFSQFIVPVLFMLSIGLGVGTYVDRGGALGAVDYVSYLAPGLLVSTAMQLAVGESTFPVFSNFEWSRYYYAMQATPVRVRDVLGGLLGFLLTRVLVGAGAFLLVMAVFGAVHSPWLLGTLPVAGLVGLACAGPAIAFAARVTSAANFSLMFRFVLIPLSLFSGVFFPVERLPGWLEPLAYVSPLWHAVELSRQFAFGAFTNAASWHAAYLLVWLVAGWFLAHSSFTRRLQK